MDERTTQTDEKYNVTTNFYWQSHNKTSAIPYCISVLSLALQTNTQ